MSEDLDKVRKDSIIKHVEDIILLNKNKKTVKKDLLYDQFDVTDTEVGLFAVVNIGKIDKNLVVERIKAGEYLFNLLKFKFISTVRIVSFVLLASAKCTANQIRKQIERKEKDENALSSLEFNSLSPPFALPFLSP